MELYEQILLIHNSLIILLLLLYALPNRCLTFHPYPMLIRSSLSHLARKSCMHGSTTLTLSQIPTAHGLRGWPSMFFSLNLLSFSSAPFEFSISLFQSTNPNSFFILKLDLSIRMDTRLLELLRRMKTGQLKYVSFFRSVLLHWFHFAGRKRMSFNLFIRCLLIRCLLIRCCIYFAWFSI